MEPRLVTEIHPDADALESLRFRKLIATSPIAAFDGLEDLARRGSAKSILCVADGLRRGTGYTKNLDRAEAWYKSAEEHGLIAHGMYGRALIALEKNEIEKALELLKKCVDLDFPPAMNVLGRMYYDGRRVETDRIYGLLLLRRGADLGHFLAARKLSHVLTRGECGLWQVPHGIFTWLKLVVQAAYAFENDPYSDRFS